MSVGPSEHGGECRRFVRMYDDEGLTDLIASVCDGCEDSFPSSMPATPMTVSLLDSREQPQEHASSTALRRAKVVASPAPSSSSAIVSKNRSRRPRSSPTTGRASNNNQPITAITPRSDREKQRVAKCGRDFRQRQREAYRAQPGLLQQVKLLKDQVECLTLALAERDAELAELQGKCKH